jgi:hypothetical protein
MKINVKLDYTREAIEDKAWVVNLCQPSRPNHEKLLRDIRILISSEDRFDI